MKKQKKVLGYFWQGSKERNLTVCHENRVFTYFADIESAKKGAMYGISEKHRQFFGRKAKIWKVTVELVDEVKA